MTVHSLLYTVHNTALSRSSHFYSASAFLAMQLAMQTAVIARPFLSVCPSRSDVLSTPMKATHDHAVFNIRYNNPSSF